MGITIDLPKQKRKKKRKHSDINSSYGNKNITHSFIIHSFTEQTNAKTAPPKNVILYKTPRADEPANVSKTRI